MKRKFLIVEKESNGNEQEKDEGEIEDEESDDGNAEEKHPPPPKKARLSTDFDEEKAVATVCVNDVSPNSVKVPFPSFVKKEPTEEEQIGERKSECSRSVEQATNSLMTNGTVDNETSADSEVFKIEKSSSISSVSSLPTPSISPPNAAEVSTTFYPDNHPVPIPVTRCSNCAFAKSFSIEFPVELLGYFRRSSENGAFQSLLERVPNILIEIDDRNHFLVFKTFSSSAIEKVRMLADAFVENSRQRQKMLRNREDNSKWSFANFESNMFDANFLVEIEVSLAYSGLAFGKNRANLAAARELYGIREITVDESQKAQGICKFKIYANNAEAADNARKILEFTDRKISVPSNAVGRLIGKYSRNINDIVSKSGVVRIFMEKEETENHKSRNFVLIGTPGTIANAEMMLQFHLWHIRERDDFDDERDELEREKSSMVDALSASAAGQRNYDNTVYHHWTSVKTPSADGFARANNKNRLPRPISFRLNRRYNGGTSADERGDREKRNEFSTGIMALPATSATPPPLHSVFYYQQPLAGTKGQFGGGRADSAETDLKHSYRANCSKQPPYSRRNTTSQQQHH